MFCTIICNNYNSFNLTFPCCDINRDVAMVSILYIECIYIYSWKGKLYATLETRVSRYTAPSEMLLTLSLLVRRRISLRDVSCA